MPLCLTREIRRVAEEVLEWPQRPRILFAAAAPPGVGQVPVESHLLALRRAVDPWVGHYDESDDAGTPPARRGASGIPAPGHRARDRGAMRERPLHPRAPPGPRIGAAREL
ncbi:MAG: hypothetical protein MZW92_15490 [Comamonadaceae bacterium]|nr:hypothetical protein [Comamonadaceae bacterium]